MSITKIDQTFHTKNGPVFDIRAFKQGSSTSGIQEAINAAQNAGGGTVYIPAGTYTLTTTLNITASGIHLQGAGKSTTTLYRTADYGDTLVIGSAVVGSILDVQLLDLTFQYNMGASSPPVSIARKPINFPNSAHVRGYGLVYFRAKRCRFNDMPWNFISVGGAYSSLVECQFQGLWDYANAALQVCHASVYLTGDLGPHGSTQGFYILDCDFFGYGSATRTINVNGIPLSMNENIGPVASIQCDYVEVLQYKGGLNGGAGIGLLLNPATFGISGISVTGVHFDGNRSSNITFDNSNSGTGNCINVEITGCDIQGSGNSYNGLVIANSSGISPVNALVVTGNMFSTYISSCMDISHGNQVIVANNSFRNYNFQNAFGASGTAAGASAIFIGGNANLVCVGPNQYGGGSHDVYGVYINNANSHFVSPGANAGISNGSTDTGLNFHPVPDFTANSYNFINNEIGAPNAIAGSLPGVTALSDGLTVTVNLAHGLQAGPNTFDLNSLGAKPIKSHRNSANDIALAYSGGASLITLTYKTTSTAWLDMSQ